MKFFIGAKDLTGRLIVAEIIEAKDFYAALLELQLRAQKIAGPGTVGAHPKFRVTAVNEQSPLLAGNLKHPAPAESAVAQFLDA